MSRSFSTSSLLITLSLGWVGCVHLDRESTSDADDVVEPQTVEPQPVEPQAVEPQADESSDASAAVRFKSRTEIDFDGVEVAGKLTARSPLSSANPDAGEGAKVKKEEGKVGTVTGRGGSVQSFAGYGVGGLGTVQGLGGLASRGVGSGGGGSGYGAAGSFSKGRGGVVRHYRSAPVTPNTEQYTNYGVNDMTLVAEDALSTFAVDVDTASYTVVRRKLQSGMLPPQSSVRVEEFVNYFPYTYASPGRGEGPLAVHVEAAPSPFMEGNHLLRVGVKAADLSDFDRVPVHLTFLVDVSGSMSSADKLSLAKRSLRFLVDQLEPEDTIAIGTYAGRVGQVLAPTPVSERALIHDALESLGAGGSTAMSSGIDLAYRMAKAAFVPNSENRVIVLSDGDANVGPASHEQILRQIREYAGQGITLTTIGFGMGNYKDTMMEQLANKGDGNYYYIDSFNEAKRVFGKNLAGTVQTVARDVKLQVEFNEEDVYAYRLIGYENRDVADRDFRNDEVDAGEIGSGHTVTALYEVVFRDGWSDTFGTVRVRAKRPGRDTAAKEWATPMKASHVAKSIQHTSRDFRIAAAVGSFAELLRGSPYLPETTFAEVEALARSARRAQFNEDLELIELIATAGRLKGEKGVHVTTR